MPTGSRKSMLFILPVFIATRGCIIIVVPLLQQLMQWLDQIVVDKCHVILNQQPAFQPAIAWLGYLVEARMQLVFQPVIMYTNTKSQAQVLSQELGCKAYYNRTMDYSRVLQQFMDRVTWVIVATSALGMGLDIPNIQCIMHMGQP
ncbi:hypothetical protein BJX76DRAFT_352976 [Aspergillus varians]